MRISQNGKNKGLRPAHRAYHLVAMLSVRTVPLVAALLQRGSLPANDGGNIAALKVRGLALRLVRDTATTLHSDDNARGSEARTQRAMLWLLCCCPLTVPLVALLRREGNPASSVARISPLCYLFALPITVPLVAALLQRGSLPLGSEKLPAYCRATTEGEVCLSVARLSLLCGPLALPITVPLAALLRRGSLPVSSEQLPAYCRATTAEAKPACQ